MEKKLNVAGGVSRSIIISSMLLLNVAAGSEKKLRGGVDKIFHSAPLRILKGIALSCIGLTIC